MMKSIVICGLFAISLLCASVSVQAGTLPSDLSWTNTDSVNKVQVVKGPAIAGPFIEIAQVAAGLASFTDATNTAGDTACYKVAYINSSGPGTYAGPVCKTFPAVSQQVPGAFQVR